MSEGTKKVFRSEAQWREIVARQAASGLSAGDFCKGESINASVFYRWRRDLEGSARGNPPARKKAIAPAEPFIDLGALEGKAAGRCEVRVDLGNGVIFSLVRG